MDEQTAWLYQARADSQAAERLAADRSGSDDCHAIAKWQQSVEKAVKSIVSALHEAGMLKASFRHRHDVARYVSVLIRLHKPPGDRTIQQSLNRLFDQQTRAGINALDSLAPQSPPLRNTEYPFKDANDQWTYPAAAGVFSEIEVRQFRALARRVLNGAERVVSALRRRPS